MKRIFAALLTLAALIVFALCLTACTPAEDVIEQTVKFDVAGGNETIPDQIVNRGDKATQPADPTRDGYMFDGWYLGNKEWNFAENEVNRNMTLTAKWYCYNVTYNLDGGKNALNNPETYTVYDEITLGEPTKPGCVFVGWTFEGQDEPIPSVTIPAGSEGDREYTANFIFVLDITSDTVTGIKPEYKSSVKVMEIPDKYDGKTIKNIGREAFRNCTALTKVTIANTVTNIGESAFFYCTALKTVDIPAGVTNIEAGAFSSCTSLESVTVSVTLEAIGDNVFSGCSVLKSINVDEGNAAFKSIDGNLYSKDGKTLIQYAVGKPDESFTVPNEVVAIGKSAFFYCANIKAVKFSEGSLLDSIGSDSFSGCSSLSDINIPNSVKTIGSYAFFGCGLLSEIALPSSLTSIGDSAFSGCVNVTSINLPSGTRSIGYYAFAQCTSIVSVYLPSNINTIGSGAFAGCVRLADITVDPANETYKSENGNIYTKDGKTLVQYATGKVDKVFTVPSNVTSIASDAFEGCAQITEVRFADGTQINRIGSGAFENCSALTTIVIPESVTDIGANAFDGCENLTIYCEAAEMPVSWDYRWNSSDRPVVWGYNPTE